MTDAFGGKRRGGKRFTWLVDFSACLDCLVDCLEMEMETETRSFISFHLESVSFASRSLVISLLLLSGLFIPHSPHLDPLARLPCLSKRNS